MLASVPEPLQAATGDAMTSGETVGRKFDYGLQMSHRVTETWMGEQVETLADLLRPGLRAVCGRL